MSPYPGKGVVLDAVNEQEIVLLTNHLEPSDSTICSIYKDRWQIELFFKPLKQNLKVKTFVGTSRKCPLHPDLDIINRHAHGKVSSVQVQIRLVAVEPGGVFALEPFSIQGFTGMDT